MTKTNKQKILFIVSTFCRYEGEMQNPWMIDTLRRLRKEGYDIDILAPSYEGLKSHTIEGFNIFRWRYFFKKWESLTHDQGAPNKIRKSLLYKFMFFPYVFFGLIAAFRIGRKKHYDHIHCHWPFPQGVIGLAAMFGSKKPKPSFNLHFHGASLLLAQSFSGIRNVLHYLIGKADRIVCNSNFTKKQVLAIRQADPVVIPYGTPLEFLPQPLTNSHRKIILTVGRIIERKGIVYLVRAMPMIKNYYDSILYIVGGGDPDEESRIKMEIQRLGLRDSVFMTGKLDEKDLIDKYKQCDVFCLPSIIDSRGDTEGLGVVLLEALNYGRPVVATDVGGISDVIKHNKTGLIADEKDPVDLAEKIIYLFDNPDHAELLAKTGCSFASSQFSWEKIISLWNTFYQRHLESHS